MYGIIDNAFPYHGRWARRLPNQSLVEFKAENDNQSKKPYPLRNHKICDKEKSSIAFTKDRKRMCWFRASSNNKWPRITAYSISHTAKLDDISVSDSDASYALAVQ